VNTLPSPNCTQTSQCKTTPPQACVSGYCEYTCSSNSDCLAIDARIGTCSPQGYCASAAEANPVCTQKSDCPAGEDCISNVCQ
jgi:hypothetical protein